MDRIYRQELQLVVGRSIRSPLVVVVVAVFLNTQTKLGYGNAANILPFQCHVLFKPGGHEIVAKNVYVYFHFHVSNGKWNRDEYTTGNQERVTRGRVGSSDHGPGATGYTAFHVDPCLVFIVGTLLWCHNLSFASPPCTNVWSLKLEWNDDRLIVLLSNVTTWKVWAPMNVWWWGVSAFVHLSVCILSFVFIGLISLCGLV